MSSLPMSTSLRIIRASVAVLLAGAAAACGGTDGQAQARRLAGAAEFPSVEVVQARAGAVPLRERLTGTVRASGEVAIYPQASGPVVEVFAQNGDAVKKGDPLVRIQTVGSDAQATQSRAGLQAARAELLQAQARLRELSAEFERNQALGKQGLVPQNAVDSLRAQTEAARAAVTTARARVDVASGALAEQRDVQAQTLVRAPITRRVGQRNVEVGMRVDAQTPLFIIGRLQNMRVEAPVAQDVLPRIRKGQRVELRVSEKSPQAIEARVSRISPFLAPGSFSAEVEIDVPNDVGALAPGMFVTVDIFYGASEPATLVPASALYENPATGERGVFVTAEPPPPAPAADAAGAGTAQAAPIGVPFRRVTVIAEAAHETGVEGLKSGEWVVVIGQHLLAAQPADASPRARVSVMDWDRIMELQQLQRHDLLRQFMDRQQRGGRES
jgi:RND family efflux transporter MFP subunit